MTTLEKELLELIHKAMDSLIDLEKRVMKLEKASKDAPPAARELKNRSSGKISRNPQARELAITMFKDGATYQEITKTINNSVPDFTVSEAAVGRFLHRYRREYSK